MKISNRLDIQRKIAYSGIGRTRKLRTHRRQLSDPKIHLEMSPLKDCSEGHYNRVWHFPPIMHFDYFLFKYHYNHDKSMSYINKSINIAYYLYLLAFNYMLSQLFLGIMTFSLTFHH